MSRYPLGRISPHGSGGKSVYQRSAQSMRRTRTVGDNWRVGLGLVIGVLSAIFGINMGLIVGIVLVVWGL